MRANGRRAVNKEEGTRTTSGVPVRCAKRIDRSSRTCLRLRRIVDLFEQVREGPGWCLPEFHEAQRMQPMRLLVGFQQPRLDSVRRLRHSRGRTLSESGESKSTYDGNDHGSYSGSAS